MDMIVRVRSWLMLWSAMLGLCALAAVVVARHEVPWPSPVIGGVVVATAMGFAAGVVAGFRLSRSGDLRTHLHRMQTIRDEAAWAQDAYLASLTEKEQKPC